MDLMALDACNEGGRLAKESDQCRCDLEQTQVCLYVEPEAAIAKDIWCVRRLVKLRRRWPHVGSGCPKIAGVSAGGCGGIQIQFDQIIMKLGRRQALLNIVCIKLLVVVGRCHDEGSSEYRVDQGTQFELSIVQAHT